MVAAFALVVLLLWLSCSNWPRRKLRACSWMKSKSESTIAVNEKECDTAATPRIMDQVILPKRPAGTVQAGQKSRSSSGQVEPC